MAGVSRSVLTAGSRSIAGRTRTLTQKTLNSTPIFSSSSSSSSSRRVPSVFRNISSLGALESMIPLHSAVASARLTSRIAVDSHCWSLLSEGFATPL